MKCSCNGQIQIYGLCDTSKITFIDFTNPDNATDRNWTEISIPEILTIPELKPDIEQIDQVYIAVKLVSKKIIETPEAVDPITDVLIENAEGTKLTGRKLIIEGVLKQKIVYTALVTDQSVHSAHFEIPFSAFIVLRRDVSTDDEFCVDICIEDVFIKALSRRKIFKNVTLFLRARPFIPCP